MEEAVALLNRGASNWNPDDFSELVVLLEKYYPGVEEAWKESLVNQ